MTSRMPRSSMSRMVKTRTPDFLTRRRSLRVEIADADEDDVLRLDFRFEAEQIGQLRGAVAHDAWRAACRARCRRAKIGRVHVAVGIEPDVADVFFLLAEMRADAGDRSCGDRMVAAEDQRHEILLPAHFWTILARSCRFRRFPARYLARFSPTGISSGCFTGMLPMSSTWWPSCFSRACKPATRSAEGPMSTPRRLWPRSMGTPIIRTFCAISVFLCGDFVLRHGVSAADIKDIPGKSCAGRGSLRGCARFRKSRRRCAPGPGQSRRGARCRSGARSRYHWKASSGRLYSCRRLTSRS